MGEGQYQALREQAQYSDQNLQQVRQVFLRAWHHVVPTGQAQPSFVKTMQGPNEPYTDFLARLRVAMEQAVKRDEISGILLQTLAFENANPECKRILGPLKGQGASIAEYIRACLGVGGTEHQANVFATALAKAIKPQKGGPDRDAGSRRGVSQSRVRRPRPTRARWRVERALPGHPRLRVCTWPKRFLFVKFPGQHMHLETRTAHEAPSMSVGEADGPGC